MRALCTLIIIMVSTFSQASEMLFAAIKANDLAAAKKEIQKGADLNYKAGPYKDPVLLATTGFNEKFEMMKLLIESGANVNEAGKDGTTLLLKASRFASPEFVEYIIKHGAKLDVVDKDQVFPLSMACASGKYEIVKLLVENGADINKVTGGLNFGYSPLISAVIKGDKRIVEYLVSKGADKSHKSSDGTALEIATTMKNEELIKILSE